MHEEKIRGTIDKIIFKNKENGYHVLSVKLANKDKTCTVVGNHVKIHEGVSMEFIGKWVTNKRFGMQFNATAINEVSPETKEAMVKYLSSTFFKGIGPVIAKKIVKHFGENVMDIFKNDIDRLFEVKGLSEKKIKLIKESWKTNTEINDIMLFLQSYDISTLFAVKIYEYYGSECIGQIKENPYRMADEINGIGFKKADEIALNIGFEKDCKLRLSAGVKHVLGKSEGDGHCYLLYEQLKNNSMDLLGVNLDNSIDGVIEGLSEENEIKVTSIGGQDRYYSNNIFYNERYIVKKINEIKETYSPEIDVVEISQWVDSNNGDNIVLNEGQRNSLIQIITSPVSVLTGGPGTGKTTTLKKLVDALIDFKIDFRLCSPTGRAAQRLTEVTGAESSTIHRMLGWDFVEGKFMHNEFNVMDCSFLIVDESSMIDINLASDLLRAVHSSCQVLFVGDVDQLPSVGAGLFFKDLINSNFVNVSILNEIYRQGEGSKIIKYAHEINKGIEPNIETPLLSPTIWKDGVDCMFIDSDVFDPYKEQYEYPEWSTLYYQIDMMGMLKKLYIETIPKYMGGAEIQILSAQNVGDMGTEKINEVIREVVNPPEEGKNEIKIRNNVFRDGDKVIMTQNDYEISCMNGDIGYIVKVNPEEKEALIRFSEDKDVVFKRDQLLSIKHAYCITIHKSQGSEFEVVVIPIVRQHYNMLYRNLIYTGITRGKKLVVFVGQRSALSMAVKNIKVYNRQTSLRELFEKYG